jgi:hypothetical protein
LGAFQFFLENIPNEYDIYLGSIYSGILEQDNTVIDFTGLTFYLVAQRFYESFLNTKDNLHLDNALRDRGRFVVCNPFSVIQHDGFSDNKKSYCDYRNCLRDRKLFGH